MILKAQEMSNKRWETDTRNWQNAYVVLELHDNLLKNQFSALIFIVFWTMCISYEIKAEYY